MGVAFLLCRSLVGLGRGGAPHVSRCALRRGGLRSPQRGDLRCSRRRTFGGRPSLCQTFSTAADAFLSRRFWAGSWWKFRGWARHPRTSPWRRLGSFIIHTTERSLTGGSPNFACLAFVLLGTTPWSSESSVYLRRRCRGAKIGNSSSLCGSTRRLYFRWFLPTHRRCPKIPRLLPTHWWWS